MNSRHCYRAALLAALLCMGPVLSCMAQEAASSASRSSVDTNWLASVRVTNRVPGLVEAWAETLEYDRDSGWLEARGNALVRKDGDVVMAPYVRVNMDTGHAIATGGVSMKRRGQVPWYGPKLTYNFKTRKGVFGMTEAETANRKQQPEIVDRPEVAGSGISGGSEPFRIIRADGIESDGESYLLARPVITTCTNRYPDCHYYVKCRKVRVFPGDELQMRGAGVRFRDVPVFYWPYWNADLRNDFGWRFYPGHSSKLGTYLLSSYKYRMSPVFRGESHFDYRSRRGFAYGQDVKWGLDRGNGDVELYYANDDKPMDADDSPSKDIDSTRYRVLLKQAYAFTGKDYLLLRGNYLSDIDLREDFFEKEHRRSVIPENYVSYTHREDEFALNGLVRGRLNDFYTTVNRMPEVSADIMPQEMGDTYLFYKGRSAVSALEKTYLEGATHVEDYSLLRFDTDNTIYRPGKYFGFLNVTPRAGYRGTYYGATREVRQYFETNVATVVGGTNVVTQYSGNAEKEADFRSIFEFGTEISYKAFKQWGGDAKPRRHIFEPHANYTFVPEPSLTPEEIYTFDSIDTLDETHGLWFGIRNKLQTRRTVSFVEEDGGLGTASMPSDLLDIDVSMFLDVDPDIGEEVLQYLDLDAEFYPSRSVSFVLDGRYSLMMSEIDSVDALLNASKTNSYGCSLGYVYRASQNGVLYGDLELFPGRSWSPSIFGRYEFEEGRMEEVGGRLKRTLDCMVMQLGFRHIPGYTRTDNTVREDEYKITLELWMTAFPELGMRNDRH
jgi:lipopolysaccharide assembly outer membrane protein LptD (OstA)